MTRLPIALALFTLLLVACCPLTPMPKLTAVAAGHPIRFDVR
jgi:hypothetical protein